MSIFLETFSEKELKLTHDEVVELINSAEGLTYKERCILLADWGEVSQKGVGGQHFEALKLDEQIADENAKTEQTKKSKKKTDKEE